MMRPATEPVILPLRAWLRVYAILIMLGAVSRN
jgi:hypothetical protein